LACLALIGGGEKITHALRQLLPGMKWAALLPRKFATHVQDVLAKFFCDLWHAVSPMSHDPAVMPVR
jgi:hypothetical protein